MGQMVGNMRYATYLTLEIEAMAIMDKFQLPSKSRDLFDLFALKSPAFPPG
jgi:hypothetical protein